MLINEELEKQNLSRYRLSKESGVPQATISDICSGKADLERCAAGTLYRLAKVLGITVDAILESEADEAVSTNAVSSDAAAANETGANNGSATAAGAATGSAAAGSANAPQKGAGRSSHASLKAFKNETSKRVQEMGDLEFIIAVLRADEIRELYDREQYQEACYLLAMIDSMSRENDIPISDRYDDIRDIMR